MRRQITLIALVSLGFVGPTFAEPKDLIERTKWARDKAISQNNLKQIAIAFHAYHDVNGNLPKDIVDKNGKPILSWRVEILPYIEQQNLYNLLKRDEPWDSENNKKLLETMPKIYMPVRGTADKGKTFYQAFSGNGALMGDKPVKLTDITDGLSRTLMVVEADKAVEWAKPSDIPFDPRKPLPKLGGLFDGDFNAALCDGSVEYIPKSTKEDVLKKMITIAGGEVINDKDTSPKK